MEHLFEETQRLSSRHRKKQIDPICCPVCGVTVRASEIEQHYSLEVDRLMKLQLNQKIKKTVTNGSSTYHDPLPGCSSNGNDNNGCPWVTFQKIRHNRHSRLRIKPKKRKPEEPICPVCNERPNEDINYHVEHCLRRSENAKKANNNDNNSSHATASAATPSDDDESIDIEGGTFDEYEWAGQKRIRASSLLQGGYSATGIGTSMSNSSTNDDEDEDLNVDGDDTQIYGPPQYSERDVIVPMVDESEKEKNDNNYLRKLVTGHDATTIVSNTTTHPDSIDNNISAENSNSNNYNTSSNESASYNINNSSSNLGNVVCTSNAGNNSNDTGTIGGHVIESLKAKIREYENQISNKVKCLICMDEFRNPAVSICCWHVHCEECWLRTLGARKLCPQCNMITSPSDLRRIYM